MTNFAEHIYEAECATTNLVALAETWKEIGPPDDDSEAQVYLWSQLMKHVRELSDGLELAYKRAYAQSTAGAAQNQSLENEGSHTNA